MEPSEEYQHHSIWTPELVEISLPLAGVARRCIAMLIDQIIVGCFVFALVLLGIFSIGFTLSTIHHVTNELGLSSVVSILIVFLLAFLFYFMYFWGFHTWNNGQTIGKLLMKIRLVTDQGGRPNGWTCFIRQLFDILDMALFYGGIGVMMILMTDREKRIADFAAGTIVMLNP